MAKLRKPYFLGLFSCSRIRQTLKSHYGILFPTKITQKHKIEKKNRKIIFCRRRGVPPNLQDARKFDTQSFTHKNIEFNITTGGRMRNGYPRDCPAK